MSKNKTLRRWIAILLVVTMLPVIPFQSIAAASNLESLSYSPSDYTPNTRFNTGSASGESDLSDPLYADTDVVRVSIVLNGKSTIDAGYDVATIATDKNAIAYRDSLEAAQETVAAKIEKNVLNGEKLDVVWNLTLAANIISANVEYGKIAAIKNVAGVKNVVVETQYLPDVVETDSEASPNLATSGAMVGSENAWLSGYTGAGRKIAIIDTGLTLTHQSFDADAFEHSLSLIEDFDTDKLMTAENIADVLEQLNAYKRKSSLTAEDLYVNSKVPFGYNYIDNNLTLDHSKDTAGQHGSHVAGIAAANAYIPAGDGTYKEALESVYAQGVAPDAQIIVMKVFGAGGGAYDSDYFAAVEDAIVLGCDAANLSLGSVVPGFSVSLTSAYQEILDGLTEKGLVMVTSAGNNSSWPQNTELGYLYGDDINFQTGGSPGSFANTLSVASVDNDGTTGLSFSTNGKTIVYNETSYTNQPLATLAGKALEFVYIDGAGTEEEFEELASLVAGKVAVCNRGDISFYVKANNAVAAGAVAVIIVNNAAGIINMDLTDYTGTAPVVSITMADGEALKQNYTAFDGAAVSGYYTGTLEISDGIGASSFNSKYYTLSSFSSWGIPGSLTLKPEITAPGGSIYSVLGYGYDSSNGYYGGDDQYEAWSGTSMAAPQITGMVALVDQFLEDKGYSGDELNRRTLALSLLMSTAVPMVEGDSGSYYSVLGQGSGLANVGSAVNAQSYILMGADATASYADGKVKAELGDDPTRSGKYEYTFTINNLSGTANIYTLTTDLFTQELFEYDGVSYLDTWTTPIDFTAEYTIKGNGYDKGDVNMDGKVDELDAQAILDFLVTGDGTGINQDAGDMDRDGKLTSYDAHLILANAFMVPANGSVEITVSITVDTESLSAYKKGAYIEGYTFVNPVADKEGNLDVTHSIPLLAYYGSWTDASMFEHGSLVDTLYGDENAPYVSSVYRNYLSYKQDGETYYQIGNPYGIEDVYPAGKAAIRSTDTLYQIGFTLIRNAATMGYIITDAETGDVLAVSNPTSYGSYNYSAYYNSNTGAWANTGITLTLNQKVSTLAKEGQKINVSFVAIPEYYLTEEQLGVGLTADEFAALVKSDVLGKGAFLTTTLNVDDTAPTFLAFNKDLTNDDLVVTVADNFDIAYLAVLTKSGTKLYADVLAPEVSEDGTVTYAFPAAELGIGSKCMVVACDYAGNETAVVVNYGGKDPDYTGKLVTFANATTSYDVYRNWLALDPATVYYTSAGLASATGIESIGATDLTITAAEYIDGYVFFTVGTTAATLQLYVAELLELDSPMLVGTLKAGTSVTNALTSIRELAYNAKDGKLYAKDSTNYNRLYTIDPLTGVYEQVSNGVTINGKTASGTYNAINAMAIDDDGVFYGASYGLASGTNMTSIVTWTLNEDGSASTATVLSTIAIANYYGDMAYDHTNKTLYLATSSASVSANNKLYKIDPKTGEATLNEAGGQLYFYPTALMWVGNVANTPSFSETAEVSSLALSASTLSLYTGGSDTLTYTIAPWTLSDKTVTWTSSDITVATVSDKGVVTGVKAGTATITATSNADNSFTASCTVTVQALPDIGLSALIYGADSNTYWSDYNVNDTENWAPMYPDSPADYYIAGGLGLNGKLYVHDGATMYGVDPDTFKVTNYGTIASSWQWSDAAPAPSLLYSNYGFELIGLCYGGQYIELLIPTSGSLSYFDQSATFASDPMATIAYAYSTASYDYYYVVTESGALYRIYFNASGSLYRTALGNTGVDLTGVSDITGGSYASMEFVATGSNGVGYLVITTYTDGGESAKMNLVSVGTSATATKLLSTTEFGEDVWPVVVNYQYDRLTDIAIKTDDPASLTLSEGATYQYEIEVILYESDDSVTWKSSDPSVATVSDNGLITAVSAGTATITVTTNETNKDGEPATLEIAVIVKGIPDVNVTGVLVKNGKAQLFDWDIKPNDLNTGISISENPANATNAGDDSFYLMGTDYNMHKLSKDNGTDLDNGPWAWSSASPTPWDMDYTDGLGLSWSYGYYLMVGDDPTDPSYMGFNLGSSSTYNYPYFYGVAVIEEAWTYTLSGTQYKGDYILYAVDDMNRVFEIMLYPSGTSWGALIGYYSTDLPVEVDYDMSTQSPLTSLAVADDGETLYYAVPVDDHVEIYTLVYSSTTGIYEASLVAATEDGVSTVQLFEVNRNTADSGNSVVKTGNYTLVNAVEVSPAAIASVTKSADDTLIAAKINEAPKANQAAGSLNAVVGEDENEEPAANEPVVNAGTATVEIVSNDFTNGLYTVKYDASKLTYKDHEDNVDYIAVGNSVSGNDGTIKIAFADRDEFNGVVTVLVFTYEEDGVHTEITVALGEYNDVIVKEPEEVPYDVDEHVYGEPEFTFSDDGKSATATFTCDIDDHTETVDATVTSEVTTPATCEEKGTTTYTATVEFEGKTYTATTTRDDVDELGHKYGEPTFEWAADGKSATATFVCENDPDHVEHVEATEITSEVTTDPTCYDMGTTTYTATFEFEGKTYTSTKEVVDVPATDHSWGEPTFDWAADGSIAYAVFTCENDHEHTLSVKAAITSEITTPATCEEKGTTTYTATVTFNGKDYTDKKEIADVPANGHAYGEPEFTWSADGKTATAKVTCATDSDHTLELDVTMSDSVKSEPTCEGYGTTTYTATVVFNGKIYTASNDVDDIDPVGHAYGEYVFNWAEDGKSASVTFTCGNNNEHKLTLDAAVTSAEETAPTCETKGTTKYTATLEYGDKTYTDTKYVDDIDELGHAYGEPTFEWAADGSSATATFTCANDDTHVVTVSAKEIKSETVKSATCDDDGMTKYTATFEFNGETYEDSYTVADLGATGHAWGEPEFTFSEDGTKATVTFTCANDPEEKLVVDAAVTSAVTLDPTCETKGTITFTATYTLDGETYTATKNVDLDALGHNYGEPVFTFSEDGKTATATFTCANDSEHTLTLDATVTSAVKTPATETEKGTTTYTATVEYNGVTYTATKDVADIPATGSGDAPKTGDSFSAYLYITLLVMSMFGFAIAFVPAKSKRRVK